MNQLREILQAHLTAHPISFGMSDADSVLEFLYDAYCEAHECDSPGVRMLFESMGVYLELLPVDKNNVLFSIIIQLCTEHECRAFKEGIRWGVQLASEI